jgi:hypothetical protein
MAKRPTPPTGREQRRHLFCESYEACLDVAIAQKWPGFDCVQCPQGEGERMPAIRCAYVLKQPEAMDADALATMAALVKAEHMEGGPASPRAVGAFLGMGGKGASLMLTELEQRGMVRRLSGSHSNGRWTLK